MAPIVTTDLHTITLHFGTGEDRSSMSLADFLSLAEFFINGSPRGEGVLPDAVVIRAESGADHDVLDGAQGVSLRYPSVTGSSGTVVTLSSVISGRTVGLKDVDGHIPDQALAVTSSDS